ncbi:MAG: tetratricopeptide repeat protein [Acidobacteria bacterium]|nr:tetratricopeptide repeat protein [Acidobacteriota bacterium]
MYRLALAGVFLLALALRAGVVLESSDAPYHRHLVLDAATYSRIAVEGDPAEPFWQPPLYPWFLRGVYAVAGGPAPVAARLVQSLMGALAALLIALVVRRFAGPRAAIAAGLALALLGSLVYFDNELLPASPAVLLVSALLFLLARPRGAPAGRDTARALGAGALLGAGLLLLPTLAIAGVLLAAWLGRRHGWRAALAFGLAALLPVLPVTLRNARYERGLVPISWNSGINLWIGNNPDYPQTVAIRPGIHWTHLAERPRCVGHAATRAEESAWFTGEVRRYAFEQPLAFLGGMVRKALQSVTATEIGRNRDIYDGRDESLILRVLLWPFGVPFAVLFAAAGAGSCALARRRELPWAVLWVALGVLAVSVIFFPSARYRAPALPALVVLAAIGLPRARWKDAPAALAALALTAVPPGVAPIPRSETLYAIAMDLDQDGDAGEAVRFYREALALDPDNADIHLALGLALGKLGRDEEGRPHLERAAQLEPQADVAWQALAIYWQQERDRAKVRECLDRALAINPCNRRARAMLAHWLMDGGLLNEAARQIEQAEAISARPDSSVTRARQRLQAQRGGGAPARPALPAAPAPAGPSASPPSAGR